MAINVAPVLLTAEAVKDSMLSSTEIASLAVRTSFGQTRTVPVGEIKTKGKAEKTVSGVLRNLLVENIQDYKGGAWDDFDDIDLFRYLLTSHQMGHAYPRYEGSTKVPKELQKALNVKGVMGVTRIILPKQDRQKPGTAIALEFGQTDEGCVFTIVNAPDLTFYAT